MQQRTRWQWNAVMKSVSPLVLLAAALAAVAPLTGCGDSGPSPERKPFSSQASAPPAPTQPTAEPARTPAPPATEQVPAEVGVGAKGHGYGGGLITEPVHQYFASKERIAFEIEIPKALQMYKATHDFKSPPTHEAFMKDVIEENLIKLPELPAGHRYLYDPKTETLMVERPAPGNHDGN